MDDVKPEAAIECGLFVLDQDFDIEGESKKPVRSPLEEDLVRNALPFMKRTVAKFCDIRGQAGPAPADFGDHKPIPVDSVCASVVLSANKENQ